MKKKTVVKASVFAIAFMLLGVTSVMAADCEPVVYDLTAGQDILVGSVTVWNDEENLYVHYETTEPWLLNEVHLYILDYEPTARLPPGLAPFKDDEFGYEPTYTFTVPFDELSFEIECDMTIWLQAHAVVVILDEFGVVIEEETAYGGTIYPSDGNSWYGNIAYIICCEEPPEEWCEETAWGGDSVGGGDAWWYYYDADVGGVQTIWAGQTMPAGTVEVVGGTVYIMLDAVEPWILQDVEEPVKIQGYDEIPDERPAAGGFEYKGEELTVSIGEYAYYAIHLDVQHPCDPEDPPDEPLWYRIFQKVIERFPNAFPLLQLLLNNYRGC